MIFINISKIINIIIKIKILYFYTFISNFLLSLVLNFKLIDVLLFVHVIRSLEFHEL